MKTLDEIKALFVCDRCGLCCEKHGCAAYDVEKHLCRDYENRPEGCRAFPFVPGACGRSTVCKKFNQVYLEMKHA
jgi:Fe-S-cluster containining protein